MRISDWSSDVCSSDLSTKISKRSVTHKKSCRAARNVARARQLLSVVESQARGGCLTGVSGSADEEDRKSVVSGKSVSVSVALGVRRINHTTNNTCSRVMDSSINRVPREYTSKY